MCVPSEMGGMAPTGDWDSWTHLLREQGHCHHQGERNMAPDGIVNPKSLASTPSGPDPEAIPMITLELNHHLGSGVQRVSGHRNWTSRGHGMTDASDHLAQGAVAPFCWSAQCLSVSSPAPSTPSGSLPKSSAQLLHQAHFFRRWLRTTWPSAYGWLCPGPSSVGLSRPAAWCSSFLHEKADNEGCAL